MKLFKSRKKLSIRELRLIAKVGYEIAQATGLRDPIVVKARVDGEWVAMVEEVLSLQDAMMNILIQNPDAEDDMFFAIPIDAEEEPVMVRVHGKGWDKAAELLTGDPAMLPLSVKKALKAKVIEA